MNEKFERTLKKEFGIIAESLGFKERKHFFLNKLRPIGYFKSLTPNVSAFMSFRFFGHHKLYSEATVEVGIKYNDISEFLSKSALVFMKEEPDVSKDRKICELYERIGELDVMVDFLKKKL